MNKRLTIALSVALALLVAALLTWFLSAFSRPAAALTLVKYTKWPHGATLQLTNRTQRTITYINEPVLFLQNTSNGWTNTSLNVRPVMGYTFTPAGRTNRLFFFLLQSTPPKPGDRNATFPTRELKPGQSAEFWLRLEPDQLPKRVGTIYVVPPSKLASKLQPYIAQARRWIRLKQPQPGQIEVWCPTPLSAPP